MGRRSRSFSRLSPPVSDGLSAQTKWRLVVSTPLIRGEGLRYSNIRRERGEEGERATKGRRVESVFGNARECPETGSVLFSADLRRFQSAGDGGAPGLMSVIYSSSTTARVESDLFSNNVVKYSFTVFYLRVVSTF